ncbi:MAG TPA: thiolase family protein [Novosphingobium sp.]|nr:thiolase family protein [Novosphingobium sp.]
MSAVIISAVRSAVATSRKGTLANTQAEDLAIPVLQAAVKRAGVDPSQIDDVVLAESGYGGGVVARYAASECGMTTTAGAAVNRHCAGSLTALGFAAGSIVAGMERFVVAGGVYSSSTAPKMTRRALPGDEFQPWFPPTHVPTEDAPNLDMSITVGWNAAKAMGFTREQMDAWALRSHQRAVAAIDAGHFVDEIVPVMALMPDGSRREFSVDEHPRRDSSMESLAALRVIHPEIEGFSITAGNASGVNDAASAMVLTSADIAAADRLDVKAKVLGWTAVGIPPRDTGLAVGGAIIKLLGRVNRKADDVALWEINEAFASVPMAAARQVGISEDVINISGSGCSIGHPIAASGGRMIATLINDLKRRGGGLGVAAMCAGGGMAGAVMIEV